MFSNGVFISGNANIPFIVELIGAVAVLIYFFPKRKLFPLRLVLSIAVVILCSYYFVDIRVIIGRFWNNVIRYLYMWLLTVIAAFICFDANPLAIIATCSAGIGLQNISFKTYGLFLQIILALAQFKIGSLTNYFSQVLIVFPFFYLIAFFTIGKYAKKTGYHKNFDILSSIISSIIVLIVIILNRFDDAKTQTGATFIILNIYAIMSCLFAIMLQYFIKDLVSIRAENKLINVLLREKEKQYTANVRNINEIGRKLHDLKYIKKENMNFDAEIMELENDIKSGNIALDLILKEKLLECREQKIKFSYLCNGKALNFMKDADIYVLLANALDNAIEAASKVEEAKRLLSISVEKKENMAIIVIYNSFNGILIKNGEEIISSKEDANLHGYGLKSIKFIAEKYGGGINIKTDEEIFSLYIYMNV